VFVWLRDTFLDSHGVDIMAASQELSHTVLRPVLIFDVPSTGQLLPAVQATREHQAPHIDAPSGCHIADRVYSGAFVGAVAERYGALEQAIRPSLQPALATNSVAPTAIPMDATQARPVPRAEQVGLDGASIRYTTKLEATSAGETSVRG